MKWRYYHHAMVPFVPPHETVDLTAIEDGSIWRAAGDRRPLLARWITDFDCGYETPFWYVIKDDAYELAAMKAKRRYEITKARKHFEVRVIDPGKLAEELYRVQMAAIATYPESTRPVVEHDRFVRACPRWGGITFGAFEKDETGTATDKLCGYAFLSQTGRYINFAVLKADPATERDGVNAALVDGILTHYAKELVSGEVYICDGSRSIRHETAFQDYLEKYFGFRKAYCHLKIVYRPILRPLIAILYVFRKLLRRLDKIGAIHTVNSLLEMEAIKRECEKIRTGRK